MTGESEARDRLQEAFARLGEAAAPGPECPSPDQLWCAATGEAATAERHEIIAHTASCASCATAFRLARGLLSGEQLSEELSRGNHESAAEKRLTRRRWRWWGSIAATLAAASVLAILFPDAWRDRPAPYRGGVGEEIRSRLEEQSVLPRERAELLWTEGPPGSTYEVRVLTSEGAEVAVETGLAAPRWQIPPSALVALPAGTTLYWQVKVLWGDGESAVSGTFEIRLR